MTLCISFMQECKTVAKWVIHAQPAPGCVCEAATAWQYNSPQLLSYGFGDRLEGVPDLLWVHEHFITGAAKGSCSLLEKGQMPRSKVLLLWRLCALSGVCAEALLQHVYCRSKDGGVPATTQRVQGPLQHSSMVMAIQWYGGKIIMLCPVCLSDRLSGYGNSLRYLQTVRQEAMLGYQPL